MSAIGPVGGTLNEAAIDRFLTAKTHFPYLFLAAFIVVFGVLVAIYRFHLVEITRNEQLKLGFWRIRIAANNTSKGFQSEVRRALTENAFFFERKSNSLAKEQKIESPLPGHPGSDLATIIANKVFEKFDISVTEKGTDTPT